MIDALFGSKTRVKLLHLFFNNPDQSYYVREITRIIGEQINSVRRELANMLNVGVIISDSSDNKLYYKVNNRYKYFVPLSDIFNDKNDIKRPSIKRALTNTKNDIDYSILNSISGLKLALISGILVDESKSSIDFLAVGDDSIKTKVNHFVKQIEKHLGRDVNYSIMSYDEFYYRLSVKDRFIMDIIGDEYVVITDKEKILE